VNPGLAARNRPICANYAITLQHNAFSRKTICLTGKQTPKEQKGGAVENACLQRLSEQLSAGLTVLPGRGPAIIPPKPRLFFSPGERPSLRQPIITAGGRFDLKQHSQNGDIPLPC
jgi:hypothetical protein